MSEQNKVTGVVLAGGMARRMQGQDKGLINFKHRPMVSYALDALTPLVDELLISANRHQSIYRQWGYPVIGDAQASFDGPLAGISAAMQAASNPILLISPCDSPLMGSEHFQRLLAALAPQYEIAVAFDGQRIQPVFAAMRIHLQKDLAQYLQNGERKLETWFKRHPLITVDFSDSPEVFYNINTLEDLQAAATGSASE